MDLTEILKQFLSGLLNTGWLEGVAVITGIASVWFSKLENIWVYPTGIVSTLIYIYLSFSGHLFGEAAVNIFYTSMSVYGWVLWTRKDADNQNMLQITRSGKMEWASHLLFFGVIFTVIFLSLTRLKENFAPGALPLPDSFASATAFTGMWLMAKKKVESWIWWIATDIAAIPLYIVKGFAFTGFFYFILLLIAISGLISWQRKYRVLQASLA